MFTGIIETTGRVEQTTAAGEGRRLSIRPDEPMADLRIGESISINGVCLTAEQESTADRLVFFTSSETLERTTLGGLTAGATVNLERALRADSRLGGHLVMGHVDGIGRIRHLEPIGEGWELAVDYPAELGVFLAPKGSVAVDGISLTLVAVAPEFFTVAVIPHTIGETNLRGAKAGEAVNLEVDVLARYVVRAMAVAEGKTGVTRELLERAGFGSRPGQKF